MNAHTPLAQQIADEAGVPQNVGMIARQLERKAAIRQLMVERDAKIEAAAKSDISWDALSAALRRIDGEYQTASAKYRKPLPAGTATTNAVFDNTVASHRYFGRL